MDNYEHLRKICIEEICNPKKLIEHCNSIISKQSSNNSWKKICRMCINIINDTYYKDRDGVIESYNLLPGNEETTFETINEEYSMIVKKHDALTIDLTTSTTHFLNKDIGLPRLIFPFLRVFCAENYENIKEMCTLLLNSHNIKEIYIKCYQIDVNDLEGVTPLQLKVILLATKIN